MGVTLTYNNPDLPDGTEVGIEGFGLLKNGESKELTEEEEQSAVNLYGRKLDEIFGEGSMVTVEGSSTAEPEEQTGTQMPEEEGQGEEAETPAEEDTTEEQEGSSEESTGA